MSIHQETPVRYTFNMPSGMHKYLRYAAIDESTHVNTLVLNALTTWIENREEERDALVYDEGMKELAAGKGESLESVRKELW